jgi:hypothetical protein
MKQPDYSRESETSGGTRMKVILINGSGAGQIERI